MFEAMGVPGRPGRPEGSVDHSRPVHQGTEHQLPSEAVRPTGSSRCQAEAQELDLFLRAEEPMNPGNDYHVYTMTIGKKASVDKCDLYAKYFLSVAGLQCILCNDRILVNSGKNIVDVLLQLLGFPHSHGSVLLLGQRAIQLVHEDLELGSRPQGLWSAVQHFRCNEQRRQIRTLGLASSDQMGGAFLWLKMLNSECTTNNEKWEKTNDNKNTILHETSIRPIFLLGRYLGNSLGLGFKISLALFDTQPPVALALRLSTHAPLNTIRSANRQSSALGAVWISLGIPCPQAPHTNWCPKPIN